MVAIRKALGASGMTQQELGERMGYPVESARKSVSQFLRSHDPRVGMVRRFATALDVPISRLLK
jgi:transcriptional regulator with XRE-family HTH domain